MSLGEIYRNPKIAYYNELFEELRFTDWETLGRTKDCLEGIVSNEFVGNDPLMKLIGSSATGTMRKGHEDLDYAVAFQTKIENEDFIKKIHRTGLDLTEINQNKAHGYVRVCGKFQGYNFVLVPMVNPNGQVQAYEQDAFYQSDFINLNKIDNHAYTVILLKEFFEQIGVYKQVKGISCEMMSLYFRDFDSCINHLANDDSLRINFSQNADIYTNNPLVIDYPFLGRRSFTDKITPSIYGHIQDSAR